MIMNWIRDHRKIVVGALVGTVALVSGAILMSKETESEDCEMSSEGCEDTVEVVDTETNDV